MGQMLAAVGDEGRDWSRGRNRPGGACGFGSLIGMIPSR